MIRIGDFRTTELIRTHIYDVLTSSRLSYGPKSKEFESKFSSHHGCIFGILSNSGTSSLQVSIQALKELHGWNDDDEVIVPATTFVATANVVIHNNLRPVFVDVSKRDYNINTDLIEEKITSKTRAIIPVHLFGLGADMSHILDIAKRYKLKVIEDACEASLSKINDNPIGSFGDIGCFSFYVSHTITCGVGGMAITSNPDYAKAIRSLCNHGWDRETRPIDIKEFDPDEMVKRYQFSSIGHSYRITEFEAALGLAQISDSEIKKNIDIRHTNVKQLSLLLSELSFQNKLQLPLITPQTVYMMYPLIVLDGDKWKLMEHLERRGIETREMLPLINQPIYKGYINAHRVKGETFPISQWIIDNGFYVGCHQYMGSEQINFIANEIKSYFSIYSSKS